MVETASSSLPERQLTYEQTFEASAVLSYHFVERGVQLREAVMIFAHRGVDLVVATVAVLAAGAILSVLNPL